MKPPAAAPIRNPAGSLLWDGYFINLDSAVERRNRIEAQLRRHNLRNYQRFPAVDGRRLARQSPCSPGEVGIFRSHLDLLERIASGPRPGHIIEDDVILSDLTAGAIEGAVRRGILGHFDILLLETYVGTIIGNVRRYMRAYNEATVRGPIRSADRLQIIDLGRDYLYGATSYVVSPAGARKVAAILGRDWRNGPSLPVDDVLQHAAAAGRLRIGCLFPFVTTIDLETSRESSAGRNAELDRAMLQRLIRYTFYVRRDISGYAMPILRQVLDHLGPPPNQEAADYYAKIIRFHLAGPPRPAAA